MRTKSTIRDVAARAGVSKVTASYVLSGRGGDARISEDTQGRVREAARDLGYSGNALARMLKTRRSHSVAIAFPYADLFGAGSDFTNEIMRGVCETARETGYDLVLHTREVASPEEEADAFSDGRVDGVLVLRDGDDPIARLLSERGVPVVSFFCAAGESWVDAENAAGADLAVRHLGDLGHRRLLVVGGSPASVSSRERVEGALAAAARLGLPEPCVVENGAPVRPEWFCGPLALTGVFAWSDDAAAALLRTLSVHGIACPADVSVVGFDSLALAERHVPPLTSVRQPVRAIARAAFLALVGQVERGDSPAGRRYPVSLNVRASTRPLPSSPAPAPLDPVTQS